jgi:hypothetical protein
VPKRNFTIKIKIKKRLALKLGRDKLCLSLKLLRDKFIDDEPMSSEILNVCRW